MYGDAPSSEVVDTENTAYHIPTQVIKHQDLPYWVAVLVKYRCGFGYQSVRSGIAD